MFKDFSQSHPIIYLQSLTVSWKHTNLPVTTYNQTLTNLKANFDNFNILFCLLVGWVLARFGSEHQISNYFKVFAKGDIFVDIHLPFKNSIYGLSHLLVYFTYRSQIMTIKICDFVMKEPSVFSANHKFASQDNMSCLFYCRRSSVALLAWSVHDHWALSCFADGIDLFYQFFPENSYISLPL